MQYDSQTPLVSDNTNPFPSDYELWLTGYWEDFTSSFCEPEASSNKMEHEKTHFGNPMNSESRLNPYYRFSYIDRVATYWTKNYTLSDSSVFTANRSSGMVTNDMNLLHNEGIHEFLTIDLTRLGKGRAYSSIINNEYLDSHAHSNRYKYAGDGTTESYIKANASHNGTGSYWIGSGQTDASFGRADKKQYVFHKDAGVPSLSITVSNDKVSAIAYKLDSSNETSVSDVDKNHIQFTSSVVTCGVFSTENGLSTLLSASTWDAEDTNANVLGAEIKSPSRTPFLAIRHTKPASLILQGATTANGSSVSDDQGDGVWFYGGHTRGLHPATVGNQSKHLRVGDIVQVGADKHCVIQEIDHKKNAITKLFSITNNALVDIDKYKPTHASYIGSPAAPTAVPLRKWFEPVIGYDGDLNCFGDGDTFHLRLCPLSMDNKGLPDTTRASHYAIRVGYDRSRIDWTSRGNRYNHIGSDYNPSQSISAIEFELQLGTINDAADTLEHGMNVVRSQTFPNAIKDNHKEAFIDYDATSTVSTPNYSNEWEHWADIDVVLDFTNQRYKVYLDGYEGGTFSFETKPSGGAWVASDFYGWHIDHGVTQTTFSSSQTNSFQGGKYWGFESEKTRTYYHLIDRVGLIHEITHPVGDSPNGISSLSDLSIDKLNMSLEIDASSLLRVNIIDDDNERKVQDILTSTPSEWSVALFRNDIDSVSWYGYLDSVRIKQDARSRTKEIELTAYDALSKIESLIPHWEVGQNEDFGPSTDYVYRRQEAEMVTENLFLGARRLMRGASSIGMDHQTRSLHPFDSDDEIGAVQGRYGARYDQRTRLFSSNPIQMYLGEDKFMPSASKDFFNKAQTAKTSSNAIWKQWNTSKIIGFSDGSYHDPSYIIAHCIEHNLEVDDTFKIYNEGSLNKDDSSSTGLNPFTRKTTSEDGMTIIVKKIIDDNHFAFTYSEGNIFGFGSTNTDGWIESGSDTYPVRAEPPSWWSIIRRPRNVGGLGEGDKQYYTSAESNSGAWGCPMFSEIKHDGVNVSIANDYLTAIKLDDADGLRKFDPTLSVSWSGYFSESMSTAGLSTTDNIHACAVDYMTAMSFVNEQTINDNFADIKIGLADAGGYTQTWKPAGLVPLEAKTMKQIHDPHGLITVGPRSCFTESQGASDTPLEYLNYNTSKERGQTLTVIDAYTRYFRTHNTSGGATHGGEVMTFQGTEDSFLTMMIRGNDIDQIEPNNLPTIASSDNKTSSGYGKEFSQAGVFTVTNKTTDSSGDIFSGTNTAVASTQHNHMKHVTTAASVTSGNVVTWTIGAAALKSFPNTGWIRAYNTVSGNRWSMYKITGRGTDTLITKAATSLGIGYMRGQHGTSNILGTPTTAGGQYLEPCVYPVISTAQAIFTPPLARQARRKYRAAHASYMHDIASSMWFRMVFGIIEQRAWGTDGPPHFSTARFPNRKAVITSSGNVSMYGDVGLTPNGGLVGGHDRRDHQAAAPEIAEHQYSDYFVLTADFDPSTDSAMTFKPYCSVPMLDENFEDERNKDITLQDQLNYDYGTDPTMSIPSRAWVTTGNKGTLNNGGLIFELDNIDGTLDVGAARSARMTSFAANRAGSPISNPTWNHYEITKVVQGEILNTGGPNSDNLPYPNVGKYANLTGGLWLKQSNHPAWLQAGNVRNGEIYQKATNERSNRDNIHSGNPRACGYTASGDSYTTGGQTRSGPWFDNEKWAGLQAGDVIFVGNTQGAVQQPPSGTTMQFNNTSKKIVIDNESYVKENTDKFNMRDLYSYRWYKVLVVTGYWILVYPAEVAEQQIRLGFKADDIDRDTDKLKTDNPLAVTYSGTPTSGSIRRGLTNLIYPHAHPVGKMTVEEDIHHKWRHSGSRWYHYNVGVTATGDIPGSVRGSRGVTSTATSGWHNQLQRANVAVAGENQFKNNILNYDGHTNSSLAYNQYPLDTQGGNICKVYAGDITISGVKHLTKPHTAGTVGRFRRIKNDFKHIWLNWADMRNDGSADADGGYRQDSWGLLYPTEDNYDVTILSSDSQEELISLKIGADIDLWELGKTDPFTSAVWSDNYTNTITGDIVSHLHNWESKAGAPIAVDSSKFFNLNTYANNGKIGDTSGGLKDIGETMLESAGEPALMDSYWWEAPPHPYNAKYRIQYEPNWRFFINYQTKMTLPTITDKPVLILDSSNYYKGNTFPDYSNYGVIEHKETDGDDVSYYTYKTGGSFVTDYDEISASDASRLYTHFGSRKVDIVNDETFGVSFENTIIGNNSIPELNKDNEHSVYSNWSSLYGLFALMTVDGFVETAGNNTKWEHDKMRLLWQMSRTKTWLKGNNMPFNYDINNVPITYRMDSTQLGGTTLDNYGDALDARGKTSLNIIQAASKQSGPGSAGNTTTFFYMVGKDNRFEFRPSYKQSTALTRSNFIKSNVTVEGTGQITNVRVVYNGGASFVDYPKPISGADNNLRWKTLQAWSISSPNQALVMAKSEYNKNKEKNYTVDATIIGTTGSHNPMTSGGRFGYISTPLIQSMPDGLHTYSTLFPHSNLGGAIIGGRQNAMDGNLDGIIYSGRTQSQGASNQTNTHGDAWDEIYIGSKRDWEYLEEGVGYHGSGSCNVYDMHDTNHTGQYAPYGVNCIEKALQIVHIPKNAPKVSTSTGNELRVFITHASNTANETHYRIWLIDAPFDAQRTINTTLAPSNIVYLDVKGNGFYEIAFPQSYGGDSTSRIIVSFNAEYCDDLLKYRSNNSISSKSNKGNRISAIPDVATSVLDLSHGNPVNEGSAFPLGLSLYYRPLGSEDSQGRQGPLWHLRPRALYYASRIEIVDDFVYRPARTITYTDANLNISSDNLMINRVVWNERPYNKCEVKLVLQKNESQSLLNPLLPAPKPIQDIGGQDGNEVGDEGGHGSDVDDDRKEGYGDYDASIITNRGIGKNHNVVSGYSSRHIKQSNIEGMPDQFTDSIGSLKTKSKISINRLSRGSLNSIRGKTDLDLKLGGKTGLLGFDKKGDTNSKRVKGIEGIGNSNKIESGSAMITSEGFTLPGVSHIAETGVVDKSDYHEGSVTVTVPIDSIDDRIMVQLYVLAPKTGGGETYSINCLVECIDSGHVSEKILNIKSSDETQRLMVFNGDKLLGANIAGNKIKITVGRVPGGSLLTVKDGKDSSPFGSLLIKGVNVIFNTRERASIGNLSSKSKLTTGDNTKGFLSGTKDSINTKTSSGTYDSSGNIIYKSDGRASSDKLRKTSGDADSYSEDGA